MRRIISLIHTSLDGFVAGPNGEMDWIKLNEELFDFVGKIVNDADTALYGRITYNMMQSYWPTAAHNPNASKHDIEHSYWYMKARKIVFSKTLQKGSLNNAEIISENIPGKMHDIKNETGKNILMLGSPTMVHFFMQHKLIDEYWINVNPVVIGMGIPLFKDVNQRINLELVSSKTFSSGVVGLHYKMRNQKDER